MIDTMGLAMLSVGMIVFVFIMSLAAYVYISFAGMTIGRKAKVTNPGLAWIPGLGTALIFRKVAKMHWWPFLLIIGFFIPILNFIAMPLFAVYFFIWWWKTSEARGFPGWTVLLTLIPFLGGIWQFVQIGILAWRK